MPSASKNDSSNNAPKPLSLAGLLTDFALFGDWEERYRYIIELGNGLEPLTDEERSKETKVAGCVSQVWLVSDGTPDNMHFRGDSDAHIVRGLVAILFALFSGKSAEEILRIDARDAFEKLGLGEHLTPQRSNGFYAMVKRIRAHAQNALNE